MLVYFFSSFDDLFIDLIFMVRAVYRRFVVFRRHKRMSIETLFKQPEKPIALMLPAWQEGDVIEACIKNLVATVGYARYHVLSAPIPTTRRHRRK